MIISYSFSLQGLSHREKDVPCQDANFIRYLKNGWVAAAIADGLGSAAHSDVAAALAVASLDIIEEDKLPSAWDGEIACALLRACFERAYEAIQAEVEEREGDWGDYSTTLTAVLYDGMHLAYGHCGDGGIIGLTDEGKYQIITEAQKGEEWNSVMPLSSGAEYWVFASPAESCGSVALLTDGLFDVIAPPLLHGDEATGGVYIPFIRQFIDPVVLGITAENAADTQKAVAAFFDSFSPAVTDDKTLLCLIREGFVPPTLDEAYYAEPDWAGRREEQKRRLYAGE
jgi:hypothetical protein